jgi:predicted lipoprotein
MRRHLALAVLALAACARTETPADTTAAAAAPPPPPPAITAADLAGTWELKTMPMDKDSVVATSELTATGTMDGWTMKMAGNPQPVPVKVVAIAGDSVVLETGQYNSMLRKGQKVSIHSISHLQSGQLTGVVHAKWANGDTVTLRTTGTKKP